MEKKGSAILVCQEEKTRMHYDKRSIQKIVKSVEDGQSRRAVAQLYKISLTSLQRWLNQYGSERYHSAKARVYKPEKKRAVFRGLACGMSIKEVQIAYNIRHSQTIDYWIREAKQKKDDLSGAKLTMMSKKEVNTDPQELQALQKALEVAHLKIKALDTMIDIAEAQLKIDIRKKSGARQSAK